MDGKFRSNGGTQVVKMPLIGDVLAVVAEMNVMMDLKLENVPLVDDCVADVVEMADYEPFGKLESNDCYPPCPNRKLSKE